MEENVLVTTCVTQRRTEKDEETQRQWQKIPCYLSFHIDKSSSILHSLQSRSFNESVFTFDTLILEIPRKNNTHVSGPLFALFHSGASSTIRYLVESVIYH